jgi:hypothetical protein
MARNAAKNDHAAKVRQAERFTGALKRSECLFIFAINYANSLISSTPFYRVTPSSDGVSPNPHLIKSAVRATSG